MSTTQCPTGTTVITGRIKGLKTRRNDFTGQPEHRMKVVDGRGFTVWGTVPKCLTIHIPRTVRDPQEWECGGLIGAPVTFTAELTPSDRDTDFGFFKRPRKAEIGRLEDYCPECADHVDTCGCERCPDCGTPVDITIGECLRTYH